MTEGSRNPYYPAYGEQVPPSVALYDRTREGAIQKRRFDVGFRNIRAPKDKHRKRSFLAPLRCLSLSKDVQ